MPSKSSGVRPLEQMGISAESELPDGIPAPGTMKSVRFSVTNPGYHFREVEKYKQTVDEALVAYADLLHTRDLDIHKLDEALARAQVDLLNKNSQIEVLVAQNGMAQETKNDEEVDTLLQANQNIKNDLLKANSDRDAIAEQLTALEGWARQVEEYVAGLEEQNAQLIAANAELQAAATETASSEYVYEEEPAQPESTRSETAYEEPYSYSADDAEEDLVVEPTYKTPAPHTFNTPGRNAPATQQPSSNRIPADVTKKFPGIRPEDLE